MKYYLAIDLGASSGRHIIGYKKDGEIVLEEIYRFKNGVDEVDGRFYWDTKRLFNEIKNGLKIAFSKYKIESLAVDTWGVDYVLLNENEEIYPVYAYRDQRGEIASAKVHDIIPFNELYKRTGIEYNCFNSIYQLYDDKLTGRLDNATDFLMLPEYFSYKLTGVKKKEWTEGTTTGLINAKTKTFDAEIIEKLGLNKKVFKDLCIPPYFVGELTPEIQKEVGGNCKVILCASHDTASAVEGIPMVGNNPYISSGTWSLLGVKNEIAITDKGEDISNEGGVGYYRHQKNIMGTWLVSGLKDTLKTSYTIKEMDDLAEQSSYDVIFDVNDSSLFAPQNMYDAIYALLVKTGKELPKTDGDIISSVYHSLAFNYAKTLKRLEENTGKTYDEIYIVGGGARNRIVNKLTEKYSNKKVNAMPIEATALGNIKLQIKYFEK